MALSTVSGILTRIGMGKLGRLGLEAPVRYERSRPGELVHIDIKQLARSDARCQALETIFGVVRGFLCI